MQGHPAEEEAIDRAQRGPVAVVGENRIRGRVLLVGPLPPPLGGTEVIVQNLARSTLRSAHDVEMVDSMPRGVLRAHRALRWIATLGTATRLVRALVRFRPQIVHVHSSAGSGFWEKAGLLLLAALFRARSVLHLHAGNFVFFVEHRQPVVRRLIHAILRRATRLVVVSPHMEPALRPYAGPGRVRVIENAVPVPPMPVRRSGPIRFVFVGRVSEEKGARVLVRAVRLLADRGYEPDVTAIGGAKDLQEMRSIIDEGRTLGLARLQWTGELRREETDSRLREHDVLVLPSFSEGLPLVVLEAMGHGLAILATRVGDLPDVVGRDGGLIVAPGDAPGLAEAMEAMMLDPAATRRMGASARHKAERRFSLDRMVADIDALYQEMLAESRRGDSRPRG